MSNLDPLYQKAMHEFRSKISHESMTEHIMEIDDNHEVDGGLYNQPVGYVTLPYAPKNSISGDVEMTTIEKSKLQSKFTFWAKDPNDKFDEI